MAVAVRQPIDVASLERYLKTSEVPITAPLELKQFGFGQSNPTYLITDAASRKYVLRKKPPGEIMSKQAHQVEREYRVLHALENTDVPVPKVHLLCEDTAVIGTAFYIMEFLDGRSITDPYMPGIPAAEQREMWRDAIRTLVKLHTIDFHKVGLGSWSKDTRFYDRQIRTFTSTAKSQAKAVNIKTGIPMGELPHLDEIATFFKTNQPDDRRAIVHGDFKIDNLLFHKTEPRVIGVLDWEMATVGHPLSDVVHLLSPLLPSSESNKLLGDMGGVSEGEIGPGIPGAAEAMRWYQESGYDVRGDLEWGIAFAHFRGCVIVQGIAARYARGQSNSPGAKAFVDSLEPRTKMMWEVVRSLRERSGRGQKL